ncbi:MAG: LPS-assembly protein LptD, partial [Pseudomonadales bacterium]
RLSEAGLISGPFEPADRWLYAMRHKGDFGYWRTTVDYTAVSDRDYFRNLGTELDVASRRELERSGQLQYSRGGFDMRFWAQRFDRLDSFPVEAYQRLPELTLNYSGFLPGPFEWSMGASGASYDRTNDELNGVNKIVGSRVHLEPRLRMPLSNSWGFLTLMGGYRYTAYDLSDTEPDVEAKPERKIGLGSADAGVFFERDMNFFGASVIQTLEPRVRYLYQQFQDQNDLPRFDVTKLTFRYDQLWRDNRFSGLDRISDADQLSVGLTSRFINAATGREYLRANLGQIRYFKDRRVTKSGTQQSRDLTNDSELAGELVGRIGRWSVGGNIIWEPNEKRTDEGGAFARFRSDNDHILYLGYRFRKSTDVDQTDISFTWPLTGRYSLIGRWNFDLNTRRIVEGLAGIEYNDCCWKIRFIARTYLDTPSARLFAEADTRQAVYLQIVFKGLAGIGNSVEPLLAKSIPGYAMEN